MFYERGKKKKKAKGKTSGPAMANNSGVNGDGGGGNGSGGGNPIQPNDGAGSRFMQNNKRAAMLAEMARATARRKDDDPRVLSSRYGDVRLLEDDYKAIRGLIGALRQEGDRSGAKEFLRRAYVEVQAARSRKEPDDIVLLATLGATSDGCGGHWLPVSLPGG